MENEIELKLARFDDIDALTVSELVEFPTPAFEIIHARIRRMHLERKGYRFLDQDHRATCETCEG